MGLQFYTGDRSSLGKLVLIFLLISPFIHQYPAIYLFITIFLSFFIIQLV